MSKDNFSTVISQHVESGNWREVEHYFNQSGLAQHMGIHVDLQDPAQPRCEVNDIKPFHLGGVGQDYINGAVISAMYDLAIGLTALAYASEGDFATTDINIRLLHPVAGNRFYMIAKVNRRIGNRVFSDATLFNFNDEACGHAHGEIRIGLTKTMPDQV